MDEIFEGLEGYKSNAPNTTAGQVNILKNVRFNIGNQAFEGGDLPYLSIGKDKPLYVRQLERLMRGEVTDVGEQRRIAAGTIEKLMTSQRVMLAEATKLKIGSNVKELLEDAYSVHQAQVEVLRVKLAVSPGIPLDPAMRDPRQLGVAGERGFGNVRGYYHLERAKEGHYRVLLNDAFAAARAWDMDGDEALAVLMRARDPITGRMKETMSLYKEPLTQPGVTFDPAVDWFGPRGETWDPTGRLGRMSDISREDPGQYLDLLAAARGASLPVHRSKWGRATNYLEDRFKESGGAPLSTFTPEMAAKNAEKQLHDAQIGLKSNLLYQKDLFDATMRYEAKFGQKPERLQRAMRMMGIQDMTEDQFRQFYYAARTTKDPQRIQELELQGLKVARKDSMTKWVEAAGDKGVKDAIVNWRKVLDEKTKALMLGQNRITTVGDSLSLELYRSIQGKTVEELRGILLGVTTGTKGAEGQDLTFSERTAEQLAQYAVARNFKTFKPRPKPPIVGTGRSTLYERLTRAVFSDAEGDPFALLDVQGLGRLPGANIREDILPRMGVEGDVFEGFGNPVALLMRDQEGRVNFWGGRGPNNMAMIPVLGNVFQYDPRTGMANFRHVNDLIAQEVNRADINIIAGQEGGETIFRGFGEAAGNLAFERTRSLSAHSAELKKIAGAAGFDPTEVAAGLADRNEGRARLFHQRLVLQHDLAMYGDVYYKKVGQALQKAVDKYGQLMPGMYDPTYGRVANIAPEDMKLAAARFALDLGGTSNDPAIWAAANQRAIDLVGSTFIGKDQTWHSQETRRLVLSHRPGQVGSILTSQNAIFNPRRATDIAKQAVGGTEFNMDVAISSLAAEEAAERFYARKLSLGGDQLGADRAGEGQITFGKSTVDWLHEKNMERLRLTKMSDAQYGPYTQPVDISFGHDAETGALERGRTRWALDDETMRSLISRESKVATHLGDKSVFQEVDEIFVDAAPRGRRIAHLTDAELMAKGNFEEYIRRVAQHQHREGLADFSDLMGADGELSLNSITSAAEFKSRLLDKLQTTQVHRVVDGVEETAEALYAPDAFEGFLTGAWNDNIIAGEFDEAGHFVRDFTHALEGRSISKLPLARQISRQLADTVELGGNLGMQAMLQAFTHIVAKGLGSAADRLPAEAAVMTEHVEHMNQFIQKLGAATGYFDESDIV